MRGEERRDLEKRGLQIEVAEEIWRAYHEVGGGEGRDGDGEEGGDGPGGDERHAQALEGGRHGLGGLHVEHRARAGARAGSGDGLEGHAQPRGAGGGGADGSAGARGRGVLPKSAHCINIFRQHKSRRRRPGEVGASLKDTTTGCPGERGRSGEWSGGKRTGRC